MKEFRAQAKAGCSPGTVWIGLYGFQNVLFFRQIRGGEAVGFRLERLREAEILGLQWSCIDFEKGKITVDKQLLRPRIKGGQYYFGPPKNDKARSITAAPYVMQILKERKLKQATDKLKAGRCGTITASPISYSRTRSGSSCATTRF